MFRFYAITTRAAATGLTGTRHHLACAKVDTLASGGLRGVA
jgi:hypothetical protein